MCKNAKDAKHTPPPALWFKERPVWHVSRGNKGPLLPRTGTKQVCPAADAPNLVKETDTTDLVGRGRLQVRLWGRVGYGMGGTMAHSNTHIAHRDGKCSTQRRGHHTVRWLFGTP